VHRWLIPALILPALIGLPLLGVWLHGHPIEPYLEFPPRATGITHPPFSWPVFTGLAFAIIACVMPFTFPVLRCSRALSPPSGGTFPWWGWLAVLWTLVAWWLAWTRWPWMAPLQAWTFTPLWLGYIVVVNACTAMRGGASLLMERPAAFARLFPVSALFWWLFEYLNRFVQNWHYGGAGELTPLEYFVQASIPFSTVLPAVAGTHELLATIPRLSCGLERGPAVRLRHPLAWTGGAMGLSALGLLGLGWWPNLLFPLVWVAPLVLMVSVQALSGQRTIFEPLRHGDWRRVWTAALAALVCGFLWELWNWHSLAHWSYTIPYVDRFHLFAMPLLGYAGYLPFGLACLVIADYVLGNERGETVVPGDAFIRLQ